MGLWYAAFSFKQYLEYLEAAWVKHVKKCEQQKVDSIFGQYSLQDEVMNFIVYRAKLNQPSNAYPRKSSALSARHQPSAGSITIGEGYRVKRVGGTRPVGRTLGARRCSWFYENLTKVPYRSFHRYDCGKHPRRIRSLLSRPCCKNEEPQPMSDCKAILQITFSFERLLAKGRSSFQ